MRMVPEQRGRGQDEPRRAEPALGRAVLDERPLNGGESLARRDALDGRDRAAFDQPGEREATQGRAAVEEDRTATAGPEVTPSLRPREVQVLADEVEEDPGRFGRDLDRMPVELKFKGSGRRHASTPPTRGVHARKYLRW